jgi:hypothetical protein
MRIKSWHLNFFMLCWNMKQSMCRLFYFNKAQQQSKLVNHQLIYVIMRTRNNTLFDTINGIVTSIKQIIKTEINH